MAAQASGDNAEPVRDSVPVEEFNQVREQLRVAQQRLEEERVKKADLARRLQAAEIEAMAVTTDLLRATKHGDRYKLLVNQVKQERRELKRKLVETEEFLRESQEQEHELTRRLGEREEEYREHVQTLTQDLIWERQQALRRRKTLKVVRHRGRRLVDVLVRKDNQVEALTEEVRNKTEIEEACFDAVAELSECLEGRDWEQLERVEDAVGVVAEEKESTLLFMVKDAIHKTRQMMQDREGDEEGEDEEDAGEEEREEDF